MPIHFHAHFEKMGIIFIDFCQQFSFSLAKSVKKSSAPTILRQNLKQNLIVYQIKCNKISIS